MTKKKNIASKLVLVLFVLTLISCCLLGSTFARYVSGGTGSATVGIAKWNVDIAAENSTAVAFGQLSPSDDAFVDGGTRIKSTEVLKVATITNEGDVDAKVTITLGNLAYTFNNGANVSETGMSYSGGGVSGTPSKTQLDGLFKITLYSNTTGTFNVGQDTAFTSGSEFTVAAKNGMLYIYAQLTWTSDDDNGADNSNGEAEGILADRLDTWVGVNVATVGATLSYTAVQASELPKSTP